MARAARRIEAEGLRRLAASTRATIEVTLLELVWAVQDVTDDDREAVAVILRLLEEGRVRLRGAFAPRLLPESHRAASR